MLGGKGSGGERESELNLASELARGPRQRLQAASTYIACPGDRNPVFLKREERGRGRSDVL